MKAGRHVLDFSITNSSGVPLEIARVGAIDLGCVDEDPGELDGICGRVESTDYLFDDLGRLVKVISPNTGTTLYVYDLAGNLPTIRMRGARYMSFHRLYATSMKPRTKKPPAASSPKSSAQGARHRRPSAQSTAHRATKPSGRGKFRSKTR